MFGWRKRNDGFEWREYVRTTILVRRKQRRDRIGEAGRAAVDNIKDVGQRGAAAGAEGAKAAGRGAVNLGHQGAVKGAAGAKVVGRGAVHYGQHAARLSVAGAQAGYAGFRAGLPIAGGYLQRAGAGLFYAIAYMWAILRTIVGIAADYIGPLLAPLGRLLRQSTVRLPLLIAGAVALLGGIIRFFANGLVRDTWIALLIGIVLLGALAIANASALTPDWLAARCASASERLRHSLSAAAGKPLVQKALAGLVLAIVVGTAIYAWNPTARTVTSRSSLASSAARDVQRAAETSDTVQGSASAVAGDVLRVGGKIIRLDGIEAPLAQQSCSDAKGRQWACGQSAQRALARLLRSRRVRCEVSGRTAGRNTGACHAGGRDVAAELVRAGHVFASTGLFAAYGGQEREARANKAGIWAGEALRPSQYREQRWEEAKRSAPDGCPIKGNVRGGRRLYVVPWASGYEDLKVTRRRGERWFCSEQEAQDAGFESSERS
ncbi:MAG: thermonuclease family protein [Hyphomicrobium sp.]|jgi:endonuclease YncB( thermonuclease family)